MITFTRVFIMMYCLCQMSVANIVFGGGGLTLLNFNITSTLILLTLITFIHAIKEK